MTASAAGDISTVDPDSPSQRVPVGKLWIDPVTFDEAMDRIDQAVVNHASPIHVVTANMQFVTLAENDPAFANAVNEAGLVVADGMPLVWLSMLQGGRRLPERVSGPDISASSVELAAKRGYRIAWLGGADGVGEMAARKKREVFPNLNVVGTYNGRFAADGACAPPTDEAAMIEEIRNDRPDILLVALGCPKQEWWIRRYKDQIDVPVCIGVGAALDFFAGGFKRAPKRAQSLGFEWLYRMAQEPSRLGRRYLRQDLPTLGRLTATAATERVRRELKLS